MATFRYDDDDDDDDQNENWDGSITGRNSFVLLIDAGSAMFAKRAKNGKTYFENSMECVKEIYLSIARKQKMELVAIVLFRTKKTEGKHAPSNLVLYQPLATVTVTRIKRLMSLLNAECSEIPSTYGHSDNEFNLAHALHYCQTVILESRTKTYIKNIIMFTCDDDPLAGDASGQHLTRKQVEEFLGHHIDFDVIGLGEQFDSSKFYKELVLTSRYELISDWVGRDPIMNIDNLKDHVDQITEKYSLRRSYLWLGSDIAIRVALCKLYNEPHKFRTVRVTEDELTRLEGLDSRVVTKMIQEYDDNFMFDEMLGDEEPIAGQSSEKNGVGDEKAAPAPDYEAQVSVGSYCLPLVRRDFKTDRSGKRVGFNCAGFVDTDRLPLYFSRGEPYLALPASNAPNIRLLFSHLLQACLDKGKSMVGWLRLSKGSHPTWAALHPTPGGAYTSSKEHSAGFILSKLCFSDDIIEPDEPSDESAVPSESQLMAADGIVKKLTINYKVDNFTDAEVRYRTNMIEALALDLDDVEAVEDDTDVDLDGISERLGTLNDAFNDCDHLGPDTTGKATKGNSVALSAGSMIVMIRQGLAHKLNIVQLKELLKTEGVRNLASMNKAMLVSVANKRFNGPNQ